MTEDVNKKENTTEDCLLLVSGNRGGKGNDKEYIKKLANAILQVFSKHSAVKLRCMGAASINNAMKSFIIAKGEALKNGDNLLINPSFTTVDFNGEEKTGMLLEVVSQAQLIP